MGSLLWNEGRVPPVSTSCLYSLIGRQVREPQLNPTLLQFSLLPCPPFPTGMSNAEVMGLGDHCPIHSGFQTLRSQPRHVSLQTPGSCSS
ncbi:rCG52003, isoform CRA_a [Rattus norvegicus]|uniref:RCG52003, isoform CRA_a n=1 Tax=Rattus norvegicus TaxID=10116 RepID=A6K2X4_RAT|nr:rCG52003, isoform CRA_a [Rattus norvegicus]EDL85727.1 rCG52003, isoform CRA_a [Rattus norvegicus]